MISRRPELNRRPTVYDTVALPAELRRPKYLQYIIEKLTVQDKYELRYILLTVFILHCKVYP